MAKLSDPITILKGVGEARAKQFANLNIFTLRDLICHFPRGYEDRTRLVTIDKLEVDVPACFRAMVMNSPRTSHIRKGLDLTKVQVADHTASLSLTFFNNKYAAESLQYGKEYIFYGAVSGDFIGYNMTNPIFESLDAQPVTTRRVLPRYPLTAGLRNAAGDSAGVRLEGIRHSGRGASLLCHSRAPVHGGSGAGEKAAGFRGVFRILRRAGADAAGPGG